jgi:hypothetical protein
MATEMELIIQALGIAISKRQKHLNRLERLVALAETDYEQMMICKSIARTHNKVRQFTNLKLKLEIK